MDVEVSVKLNDREIEILRRLRDGESALDISRAFKMPHTTVRHQLMTVYRIIGVENKTQAAVWAARHLGTSAAA